MGGTCISGINTRLSLLFFLYGVKENSGTPEKRVFRKERQGLAIAFRKWASPCGGTSSGQSVGRPSIELDMGSNMKGYQS